MNGGSQFDTGGWQAMWVVWIGIFIVFAGVFLGIGLMVWGGLMVMTVLAMIVAVLT